GRNRTFRLGLAPVVGNRRRGMEPAGRHLAHDAGRNAVHVGPRIESADLLGAVEVADERCDRGRLAPETDTAENAPGLVLRPRRAAAGIGLERAPVTERGREGERTRLGPGGYSSA